MASFLLTDVVSTPQTLAFAEVGQISPNGGIASGGSTALTMSGSSSLFNLGTMISNTATISIASSITVNLQIGASGQVMSGTTAILGSGISGFSLVNDGTILSNFLAMNLTVSGNLAFNISNSGRIEGAAMGGNLITLSFTGSTGTMNFSNSGTIQANKNLALIDFGTGSTFRFTNTGLVSNGGTGEAILARFASLNLTNSGTINGQIEASNGAFINNSGTINGGLQISSGGISTVINTGKITGGILMGAASTLLFDGRAGEIEGTIALRAGNDTLTVDDASIVITDPGESIFGGTDLIRSTVSFELAQGLENLTLIGADNTNGTGNASANLMFGNAGNNSLRGLTGDDTLNGREGDNMLRGGAGNDILLGGEGNDTLAGGRGNDTLSTSGGDEVLAGDLGVDTLDLTLVDPGVGTAGVRVALGTNFAALSNGDKLQISGFENANGSSFDDSLTGSAVDNVISGGLGNDTIMGFGGNDLLFGDSGNDSLTGDSGNDTLQGVMGQDTLSGGVGDDRFVFHTVTTSLVASPDRITDFAAGDLIDLSLIDGVPGGADDPFVFIGTLAFAGTGPQLRFSQDAGAGTTTVEARFANSVTTDMVIVLDGLVNLTADSFVL